MADYNTGDFEMIDWGDGAIRFRRPDGFVIDFFAWPPMGGPCAVLTDPAGDLAGYYDTPEEAAQAAPVMAVAS